MRAGIDFSAKQSGGTVSDYLLTPLGRYLGAVATIKGTTGDMKVKRFRLVYTGKALIIVECSDGLYDSTVSSLRVP